MDRQMCISIRQMDIVTADPTISRVALLSVTPAQVQGTELANNPPGYLDHVQLHVKGVVDAPDATPQMRTLGNQIIAALNNNVKPWLEQVRTYAQQLVKMDSVQLEQPSTLTMLDKMLSYATYAYIGQLDPNTNNCRTRCPTGTLPDATACNPDYYAAITTNYLRRIDVTAAICPPVLPADQSAYWKFIERNR